MKNIIETVETVAQFKPLAAKEVVKASRETNQEALDVNLDDVLKLAGERKQRKGNPPFVYELHADKAFIPVQSKGQTYVWIIPASLLPLAKLLWPVSIRTYKDRGGPYVARKIRERLPDGTLGRRIIVPLHRLFVDCGGQKLTGDRRAQVVLWKKGGYLDWTDGNLILQKPWRSADIDSVCLVSQINDDMATADDVYARPKRPLGFGPDMDDRESWLLSQTWKGVSLAGN